MFPNYVEINGVKGRLSYFFESDIGVLGMYVFEDKFKEIFELEDANKLRVVD